ncbi:MAG: transporter substrate-binding domain-containing protein [Parasporobacterium sp.]|nr:transporter substrate-binding domain-containing protein [Parasporobacterium sp.]
MVMGLAACGGNKAADPEPAPAPAVSGAAESALPAEAEDNSRKSEGDKFIVGFDAEYPPYGYMDDNGQYTGFDLELAQAICELTGWEYVPQPIDWNSKDVALNAGEIDCIWSGFTINGREDDYVWTVPYVNNSQVIVVGKDSGINSLADLAGKKVGVQAASAAEGLLTDGDQAELGATFAEMPAFADYNTAFTELMAGALDALAIDIGVAKYQTESRGEGFVILEEKLNEEEYGIGFKLGNYALRDQVEEALYVLVSEGKYAELAEKYGLQDFICLK